MNKNIQITGALAALLSGCIAVPNPVAQSVLNLDPVAVPAPVPAVEPAPVQADDPEPEAVAFRLISVSDFRDRMSGGLVGQCIGMAYGQLVNPSVDGAQCAEEDLPVWKPGLINDGLLNNPDGYDSGLVLPGLQLVMGGIGTRPTDGDDSDCERRFFKAMYAAAYFTSDREEIVGSALGVLPDDAEYAEMVRGVLECYRADKVDWEASRAKVVGRYKREYLLNGAIALLGFLYGEGEMGATMRLTARGGFDTHRNTSVACGVLGVTLGLKAVPPKYYKDLDRSKKWEGCKFDYAEMLEYRERLARENVVKFGGRIEKDESGTEWFSVPCELSESVVPGR